MKKEKKEYYLNKLLAEKKMLVKELKNFDDKKELSVKETTGELSSYDNHPGDQGSNTYDKELDMGLEDNVKNLLEKIETALELFEKGEYGECLKCHQNIDEERLEAIPSSIYCRNCVEDDDIIKDKETERPIEEEVLKEMYENSFNEDNVMYDGEDSWEDVAQYGTSSNGPEDIEQ